MSDPETTLPEKCCAKCGFLYGVANHSEKVFDPDLVRNNSYSYEGKRPYPDKIASIPVLQNGFEFNQATNSLSSTQSLELNFVTWHVTHMICCHKGVFETSSLRPPDIDDLNKGVEKVLSEIRLDRSECQFFYPYHPGYTPKDHSEIQLQEQSEETQRQHEITRANNQIKFEERFQRSEQRLTIIFGCIGATIGILGLCGLCIGIPTAFIELVTAILNLPSP